ncbi:MAG: MCE family protein [Nitrospira sp. CG24B]|nr:MAG: MCE family protein [Nitrospira sp. CG24B]
MEPKVNYILVGSFVAFLGAAVLVGILWLGKTDYRGSYDRYEAYMRESVAGLSVDSTVKYRGVDVGRVKSIALRPDNPEEVLLTLDIIRGTPVKTDTIAKLETQGLTGLATINLTGGSRDALSLQAQTGQAYPVIKTGPSLFFRLDEAVSRLLSEEGLAQLLVDLDSAAKGAAKVLDEDNRILLKRTIKDLSDVAQTVATHKTQIEQSLNGAARSADNLVKLTASLNEQVPTLLAGLNKSVAALGTATDELARTSKAVGTVVNEARPELQQFTRRTLPEAGQLVTELRQLTGTLNRVARELEREPSSLVFGRKTPSRGPGE